MKLSLKPLAFLTALLIFSSCASIVSKRTWPLYVGTNPSGAAISIINKKGQQVYEGITPAAVRLKSGAGFFAKESYRIKISMTGYDEKIVPVECKLNGWYTGNILIGWLVGLLIVDPATGAMYKLNAEAIHENLVARPVVDGKPSLRILTIGQVPDELRSQLVSIK